MTLNTSSIVVTPVFTLFRFSSVVSTLVLPLGHIWRTSLCAIIPATEDDTMYLGTPISIRRVMEENESFVWRVLITRWPVIAALKAISAVSRSLISPISITFGSCLNIERRQLAKVKPISGLTCIWFIPSRLYSIGSSTVVMFMASDRILLIMAYRVVVFPLPVGPVTSTIPFLF